MTRTWVAHATGKHWRKEVQEIQTDDDKTQLNGKKIATAREAEARKGGKGRKGTGKRKRDDSDEDDSDSDREYL